jgi:hypothetical protein
MPRRFQESDLESAPLILALIRWVLKVLGLMAEYRVITLVLPEFRDAEMASNNVPDHHLDSQESNICDNQTKMDGLGKNLKQQLQQ